MDIGKRIDRFALEPSDVLSSGVFLSGLFSSIFHPITVFREAATLNCYISWLPPSGFRCNSIFDLKNCFSATSWVLLFKHKFVLMGV